MDGRLDLKRPAARWAALVVLALAALAAERAGLRPLDLSAYLEEGESLLHGVPAAVSFRMPLATVLAALISHHSAGAWAQAFAVAAQSALLLTACALLCSRALPPFLAAAALLAWARVYPSADYPESFYGALVLLAAGLMLLRERRPSRTSVVLLALALGATMLFRSPLAFFPPLLALFEYGSSPRPRRERLVDAAILCVVPYLFLIPWLRLNWIAYREIVPFEYGAANSNMATGALGLVKTVEGPWQNLLPRPLAPGESLLRWAAGEIASHPVRYLAAIARRIFYVFSLHPFLSAAGLLALWRHRRERAFRLLGLLAGYYLGVHCLMTVLPRYFEPLWLLAGLIAGAAAARWAGLASGTAEGRWPRAVLATALAAVLALCAYASALVAAYAAPAAMTKAQARAGGALRILDRAVASSPGDAWLRLRRGKRRIERGDLSGAEDDFSRGLSSRPGDPRLSLELAWVRALQGEDGALKNWSDPPGGPEDVRFDACVYQAHIALKRGRTREARERLLAAKKVHESAIYVNEPATSRDREIDSALRSSDSGFLWRIHELLNERTENERRVLFAAIMPLVPKTARSLIEQARIAARLGDRRAAAAYLDGARAMMSESPSRDAGLLLASADLEARGGDWEGALRSLARAEASRPDDDARRGIAALRLERAVLEAREGRREEALRSLARVEALKPDDDGRRRMALLYRQLQEPGRALALLKALLERLPQDAGLWLERAELESQEGKRAAALESLARAEALDPDNAARDDEQRRRVAMNYQALGEYGRAIAVLDRLILQSPGEGTFYSDRGLCEHLKGDAAAALSDLETAIRLKPLFLPAYLSLAAIHAASGRDARALEVYDAALARAPHGDPLRLALLSGREQIRVKIIGYAKPAKAAAAQSAPSEILKEKR